MVEAMDSLRLATQQVVAATSQRLDVTSMTDAGLTALLFQAQQHDPASGFYRDCAGAIALGEELNKRRAAPTNPPPSAAAPVHEGGWTATQSLAFFRAHGIRGRLIGTRGRLGRELREYVCMTRALDESVSEFAHRILAAHSHHTV
jgi:hypothetical protein